MLRGTLPNRYKSTDQLHHEVTRELPPRYEL
jgi:hypothetical protein